MFERQCEQPEYYLTRVEYRLLQAHAAELLDKTDFVRLVELGAGNAHKTQNLFEAFHARGKPCTYYPIDVDSTVMMRAMPSLTRRFPHLNVHAIVGTYHLGLDALPLGGIPKLFLFLGSSIGNMEKLEYVSLLTRIRSRMDPADFLLIAADLEKEPRIIQVAYNDSAGYGRRSTLNMLSHLNWRYMGDFSLRRFRYVSTYNQELQRNEVCIVSLKDQIVTLKALGLTISLKAGEPINAEIMWKFNPQALVKEIAGVGFQFLKSWTDTELPYGLFLFRRNAV